MNLITVMRKECVQAHSSASDKDTIFSTIAGLAKKSPILDRITEDDLIAALRAREEMGTTAFGQGIAIPHCRLPNIDDFVVGLVTSKEGVEFASLDEKPVNLFVFIIAPKRESNEHIRLLSTISQVLRIPGASDEICTVDNDEALYESFMRQTEDEVDTKAHVGKNIFHVFVQKEDYFQDVLQVFAAMDSCSVLVVDAQQSSNYLARIPLFADFFGDDQHGFNRIIVALVDHQRTNDTIRRIEMVTGPLSECNDAMVAVQEVFFCNGRINA